MQRKKSFKPLRPVGTLFEQRTSSDQDRGIVSEATGKPHSNEILSQISLDPLLLILQTLVTILQKQYTLMRRTTVLSLPPFDSVLWGQSNITFYGCNLLMFVMG